MRVRESCRTRLYLDQGHLSFIAIESNQFSICSFYHGALRVCIMHFLYATFPSMLNRIANYPRKCEPLTRWNRVQFVASSAARAVSLISEPSEYSFVRHAIRLVILASSIPLQFENCPTISYSRAIIIANCFAIRSYVYIYIYYFAEKCGSSIGNFLPLLGKYVRGTRERFIDSRLWLYILRAHVCAWQIYT